MVEIYDVYKTFCKDYTEANFKVDIKSKNLYFYLFDDLQQTCNILKQNNL